MTWCTIWYFMICSEPILICIWSRSTTNSASGVNQDTYCFSSFPKDSLFRLVTTYLIFVVQKDCQPKWSGVELLAGSESILKSSLPFRFYYLVVHTTGKLKITMSSINLVLLMYCDHKTFSQKYLAMPMWQAENQNIPHTSKSCRRTAMTV